jgi:hypothetical protein
MGGLAVATALALVFLPSLHVSSFRINGPGPDARRHRTGNWPATVIGVSHERKAPECR